MKLFRVSASHVAPGYALNDLQVRVSQDNSNKLWSASAKGLGYGKDYETPELAIRELLADHAYTNITIRPE